MPRPQTLDNAGNPQPIRKAALYRIAARTGKIGMMRAELCKPNGLCFSPD
jgi:gluconolactonase